MNELIAIRGDGMFPINARDLNSCLEIETPYHKWLAAQRRAPEMDRILKFREVNLK